MISGLLLFDPAVRITVQAALEHNYLAWPKERVGPSGVHSLEAPAPAILSMLDIEDATHNLLHEMISNERNLFHSANGAAGGRERFGL